MSDQDQVGGPGIGPDGDGKERQRPSRRSVLRGAAGASAAGMAVTALARAGGLALAGPVRSAGAGSPGSEDARDHGEAGAAAGETEQVVVHVRDARTGQLDIFRGSSQIRLDDRDLAARLMRASKQSPRAL